jgi:hypothetical protein
VQEESTVPVGDKEQLPTSYDDVLASRLFPMRPPIRGGAAPGTTRTLKGRRKHRIGDLTTSSPLLALGGRRGL